MGRVRSAVARANKRITVQVAAILLASTTLVSSLTGLFRDRLFNSTYLDTYPTGADAYTAAFIIPDFMFLILVSGALSVTFIPVFNQRLLTGNKKSAWELSTSLLNLLAIATLVVSVLIMIFAEPLVRYVVGPGLDEASRSLAVSMMRVIAVNPFIFAIATVLASVQQAVGRFTFTAMAPILYNIGIIIGIVFFTQGINLFGWQVFEGGIMGVALGVVLGSVLQLVVSCIGLLGLGLDYRFKIFWKNKGFRKVLSLLPARSIDQGMDYVVGIVEMNIASRLGSGVMRIYQQASTLHMMPINLIGVAISTAAFPKMTERLASGRTDLFIRELRSVLRVLIWLILPVAVVAFFTRGYIVNFIKNGGDFLMAQLLGILVIAIIFRTIYHIAARSFYANQDTKTPLYVSIFAIGLNIALAIIFTIWFGVYGLAWAQAIVALVEVVILFVIMARRFPGLFSRALFKAFGRMALAALGAGVVSYIGVLVLPLQATDESFYVTFPKFFIIAAVSGLAYLGVSRLLRLKEADPIIRRGIEILFTRTRIKQ